MEKFVAYPLGHFPNKKMLIEAVQYAGVDVTFVTGLKCYGLLGLETKKTSEMKTGEIIGFCGPTPHNPKYYGAIVCTLSGLVYEMR